ncbi:MAG: elongation factor Ts [Bacilli bacterium]|nr:elongation factor Ts [Bacilli bacterium]
MYSASDVKELREKTGAGMMDCKNALQACNGNMDQAIDWLREKGMAKAAKKESRVAAEGITKILVEGNKAIILEVNSETDFVAKNEEFTGFVESLAKTIISSDCKDMESALNLSVNGVSLSDAVVNIIAKIGEKISFRRFTVLEKTDNQVFGAYSHMGGKIGVLVLLDGNNEEVAKDIAMHVAAMHPAYLSSNDVPSDVLDREKEIMTEQLINEGKPKDRIENILVGKVNKYYQEVCLLDQIFIKAEDKETVKKYAENNNCSVKEMIRYEVGEGIEKKQEDFAAEVMSQING